MKNDNPCATTVWLLVGFYLIQPFVMKALVVEGKPFMSRLMGLVLLLTVSAQLFLRWQQEIGASLPPEGIFMLAYYAFLAIKIVHGIADGDEFTKSFGIGSSFPRLAAFTLLPPTVMFDGAGDISAAEGQRPTNNTMLPWMTNNRVYGVYLVLRGMLQIGIMVALSKLVLLYEDTARSLPYWIQVIGSAYLCVIIPGGGINDIIQNGPTRILVGGSNGINVVIIDTSDAPLLTTSPRDFWHRWSKSAGYHLRKAFYEPLGGGQNPVVATAAAFGVNVALHVFWLGPATTGRLGWGYVWMLDVAPVAAVVIERRLLRAAFREESWQHRVANFAVFQILIVLVYPCFSASQDGQVPTDLVSAARRGLGQEQQ